MYVLLLQSLSLCRTRIHLHVQPSAVPVSNFTYWVPSPEPSPPAESNDLASTDNTQSVDSIQVLRF